MHRSWIVLLTGLVIVWLLPAVCPAQTPDVTMEEVVVTATRTETALDKAGGSSVTLITAEDIAAKKQTTVEEVLKGTPGLDVAATGGPGTQTSVFIRGADAKNTLVMIDGIMVNDPSSPNRAADLANLTTDNIERIEVVRGPLSALYGSNATGGVVNIITKTGRGEPSLYVGSEYGTYDTWKTYGGASGQWEKLHFAVAAAHTDTNGFSTANDRNDAIPNGLDTDEDDGWENTTLSGKFGVDITADFDVSATVRMVTSEVALDDFSFAGYAVDQAANPLGPEKQKTESDQLFYRFDVHNRFFDGLLDSRFFYKGADQEQDTFDAAGDPAYDYTGKTVETGWQGALTLADGHTLSLGYTYFQESYDRTTIREKSADLNSYWISDQIFLLDEALVVVAGVRLDDHECFGTETTWQVAPSYRIKRTGTTLKASYGTGFRAPSLYELFADANPAWFFLGGNEDLDPEESEGWDAGFEQDVFDGVLIFGATYFYTRYKDRIEYVTDPVTFLSTYENLDGTTTTEGVEAFIEWLPIEDLSLRLSYTHTDTDDPDGEDLVRRPENKVRFNSRYRMFDCTTLDLDVFWVDARKASTFAFDRLGNQIEKLDDYVLVNLAASYDLNSHVQLYGRIDNLFNENYEDAWSYATPGFSLYGGVKFTF